MNRRMQRKMIPQIMAAFGVVMLCASLAIAQDSGAPAQDQTAPATANPGQRTDGQIEMDVVHALDASQALKDDLITAATIQGEVTLSGTVSTQASKDLAGSIAAGVQGVTKVENNLTIGNPAAAAQAENLPDQNEEPAPDQSQPSPQNEPMPAPDNGQANAPAQQPPAAAPGQEQGQYPAPNPYPAPYPPARPQYSPYPPPPPPYGQQPQYGYGQQPYGQQPNAQPGPAYEPAKGPVTVPQGTLVQLRTSEPVDSKRAKDGTPVQFTVIQDVAVGGVLAIPRGATVHGVITEVKQSGELAGHSELGLTLTSLDLGGQTYPLQSDVFKVKSPNKAGETAGNAIGGGILGTIIGCAVGRGVGCAVGAGAGVAAGTAASAASSGPRAWIPAEALVTFHLSTPVTVNPVSPQEAARLAQGLYPGGPTLYRRGYGPYGYAPYGYPAYGYPPVYYRPYYMSGGYYYWR